MQRLVPSRLSNVKKFLVKSSQQSALSRRALSSVATLNRIQINENSQFKKNSLFSTPKYEINNTIQSLINKRYYSSASLPPHTKIRLPALSPTMEQGTIARWAKKEGDQILEGDLIAEIETDKATMGFEASDEGYLAKILVPEKTKDIPLKTLLCIVVKDKADVAAFANFQPSDDDSASSTGGTSVAPAAPKAETSQPTSNENILATPLARKLATKRNVDLSLVKGTGPKGLIRPHDVLHFADSPHHEQTPAAPVTASVPAPVPQQRTGGRVFATPYARKLAAERNIDLSLVQGSGPDGQIRANDVLNFTATAPAAAQQTVATSNANYEDIPLNNFRSVTAKRLLQSKQTIPHYYLTVELEIDNALKVRQELNEQLARDNMKLSLNDLIVKAAAMACRKVPECNSSWMDTFIRKHNTVDVCVAVATDNGLITPIVFNADTKGLASISFDVTSLAKKARNNKLKPHEFQGGTFTISNLGMFGIKHFAAVINPPQACILAVGGSEKRVVPDEKGGLRTSTFMSVTLSCDHRVVDGAVGAKWLDVFKKYIQNPISMLL